MNMELWTFNTKYIQEIDIRWSDRIVIIIIIIIILIIREDKFSICECACLEKKIFKWLHQIFYVQFVLGYYFANNVDGATIWTKFDNTYSTTICM